MTLKLGNYIEVAIVPKRCCCGRGDQEMMRQRWCERVHLKQINMLLGVLARKKGPRRGYTKSVSEANHCNHLSNLKVCQNQIWECIRYFCRNELKRDSHRIARVRSPVDPCRSPFRPIQWVGPTVDAGEGFDVCEWR